MKIHVAGFNFTYTKPDTFSAPYHGMICEGGLPQHWEPSEDRDELCPYRIDPERLASLRREKGLMSSSALYDLESDIRDLTKLALLAEQQLFRASANCDATKTGNTSNFPI
jgi:hypothetical protein